MLKYLWLALLFAALGTAVGVLIMKTLKRRTLYLESVCDMIAELDRNIAYRKDEVKRILENFSSKSRELTKNIDEYIKYLGEKDGALALSHGTLGKNTFDKMTGLFGSLGRGDGESQLGELKMYGSTFKALYDEEKARSDKFGPLAVKLGFLFGLLLGILVL